MKKNKTLQIREYELPIAIQEEKRGGFTAVCTLWADCYAQGESIEEVLNEISYVASTLLEMYKEEGIKIPLKLKKQAEKETKGFTLSIPLIVSTS